MKIYSYIGPENHLLLSKTASGGKIIRQSNDVANWSHATHQVPNRVGLIPATFVIDLDKNLRLADRRSEHVACAQGKEVLSAGEIFFAIDGEDIEVIEISNQSTGYCPDPDSWLIVEEVLNQIGIRHPGRFTLEITFAVCQKCGQKNIVKGDRRCGNCGFEIG
jgi:hypothetical protein